MKSRRRVNSIVRRLLDHDMKMRLASLLIMLGMCCTGVTAQVPSKKDDLTISDREAWRKILEWPDHCEDGFQGYKQYYPPGGLTFDKLGKGEYLVEVGCSGSESVFMYYRDNSRVRARLLKFKEYDLALGSARSSYSRVNLRASSFDTHSRILGIISQGRGKNVCLTFAYRMSHGRPVFLKGSTVRCSDLL